MNARQSTARTFMIGPVLDATGVAVTDRVVSNFKLSKNGAAPAALNGSSTLTHRHTGHYSLAAAAGDYDTVGTAQFVIDDTTNACNPVNFDVIEEAIYDALFAASAAGYQTPQSFPANFALLGIDASGRVDVGKVLGQALSASVGPNLNTFFDAGGFSNSIWTLARLFSDLSDIVINTDELQIAWTDGGRLDLILDNIDLAGTRFLTMIVLDGAVYQFTANALELAPTGGGDPLLNAVPAAYVVGTAGYNLGLLDDILTQVNLIGSGTTITITAPFVDDDGIIQGIIQGDDLKAIDGRAITVSIPLAVCDLTGALNAVMKIQIIDEQGVWNGTGDSEAYVITGAGTASQAISFDFGRLVTVNLSFGEVLVDVEMELSTGNIATVQFQADIKRQAGTDSE